MNNDVALDEVLDKNQPVLEKPPQKADKSDKKDPEDNTRLVPQIRCLTSLKHQRQKN